MANLSIQLSDDMVQRVVVHELTDHLRVTNSLRDDLIHRQEQGETLPAHEEVDLDDLTRSKKAIEEVLRLYRVAY